MSSLTVSSKGVVTGGDGFKRSRVWVDECDRAGRSRWTMRTMCGNVAVHSILSGGTNARRVQARQRAHVTLGEMSNSGSSQQSKIYWLHQSPYRKKSTCVHRS